MKKIRSFFLCFVFGAGLSACVSGSSDLYKTVIVTDNGISKLEKDLNKIKQYCDLIETALIVESLFKTPEILAKGTEAVQKFCNDKTPIKSTDVLNELVKIYYEIQVAK